MDFVDVFKKFEILGKALNFIISNSNSNYNPYHNLNHNITVTIFCYHIGNSEKIKSNEMKELLIAALFHDFNHSGGEKKDDVNINNAKKGIKNFFDENDIKDINLNTVYEILDATEFPYKIENSELNKQQKIIRDADLCQLFESTRLQTNYLGLQKETKIDFKQQLQNQKKFYAGIKFNTKAGKALFEKFKDNITEELEYLIKISE